MVTNVIIILTYTQHILDWYCTSFPLLWKSCSSRVCLCLSWSLFIFKLEIIYIWIC